MRLEIANKILRNADYTNALNELKMLEKDRKFCKHDMEHFLSVARITMILCYETGIDVDEDIIYSSALLHDIGRIDEYKSGVPHDQASLKFAKKILSSLGISSDIEKQILSIISSHRDNDIKKNTLAYVFYTADKHSRMCFLCDARSECNWSDFKKNMHIKE